MILSKAKCVLYQFGDQAKRHKKAFKRAKKEEDEAERAVELRQTKAFGFEFKFEFEIEIEKKVNLARFCQKFHINSIQNKLK